MDSDHDTVLAEWVTSSVLEEARPYNAFRGLGFEPGPPLSKKQQRKNRRIYRKWRRREYREHLWAALRGRRCQDDY